MSEGEEGLVDIVDRARAAFNNNEFTKAVDLFTQALSTDPSNVELLVCRAHAHTKAENYPAGEYVQSLRQAFCFKNTWSLRRGKILPKLEFFP